MEYSHGQSDVVSSRFSSKMNTVASRLVGKYFGASLVASSVKNLPAMQKTCVRFLGWEDPLEKEMATHSSIFAWRIPVDRGAWQATVHGVTRVRHDLATKPPPPSLSYLHKTSALCTWLARSVSVMGIPVALKTTEEVCSFIHQLL